MTLDLALVSALVAGGRDAIRHAIEKGVAVSKLEGDGAVAFEFLDLYLKTYSDAPSADAVFGKTGVKLPPTPPEPSAFYVDEVLNRQLHNVLGEQLEAVTKHFQAMKPVEAYQAYEAGLRALRECEAATSRIVSLPSLGPMFLDYFDQIKAGKTGVLTPWPTINEETMGFWPEDFALFVARLGIGKCVEASTLITDPESGVPRTIEQVYRDPSIQAVASWSEGEGVGTWPIKAKVDTGTKECLRVKLGTGREVTVTPEHPFLTPEGWKRADEVKAGQSLAIPARMPFPEKPSDPPIEEPLAFAILLAEGSYSGNHVGFSSGDQRIVELAEQVGEYYSVDVKHRRKYDYDFVRRGRSGPNNIRTLLQSHGMDGKKAVEKTIPDAVFRYGPDALAVFLTVFWMCDGYVTSNGAEIVLGSEVMLRQIQSLLLRFGVQSRVSPKPTKYKGQVREAWRLRVLASGYETLRMVLGLWGHKAVELSRLANKPRNPNVGFPRISDEHAQQIKDMVALQSGRWEGGLLKEVGRKLGWSSYFMTRSLFGKNNTLLLDRFKVLCEVYEATDQYRWLWDSGLFWDTIEAIDPVGECKVYDLTVEPTSCFVANDILVHNTWALTIMANHAWHIGKHRVLFATTEMSQIKIMQRWIAVHLKLPYRGVRLARLAAFAEQKMRDTIQQIKDDAGLYIIGGDFDFRIESLEAAIEEAEPDIVFLDGAYLLKSTGDGRTEKAANSFDELKRVAKRCQVPLVASTQFNREVKGNKLSSAGADKIALSDAAGWNADLIYGLVRTDDMKRDRRMVLKPLKFREGEGEDIECWWDFDLMRFDELPKGQQAAMVAPPGAAGGGGGSTPAGGMAGVVGASQAPPDPDPDPFGTGLLDFGTDQDDPDPVPGDDDDGVPF